MTQYRLPGWHSWWMLVAIGLSACARQPPQQSEMPSVEVAEPVTRVVTDRDTYPGRFESADMVEIRPRVSGLIDAVLFKDGDVVRRGDPLFRIDTRPFAAAVEQAAGQMAAAQSQFVLAAQELGPKAAGLQGSAASLEDLDRMYAAVKAKAGRVDVLFVNAGFYEFKKMGEITEEHFDNTFDTNVRGALFTVQKALPLMAKGSSVILVGSIASQMGIESFSVYNATKAALRAFARSWIVDLKPLQIRVNVLSPGHTDTPGLNSLLSSDQKKFVAGGTPIPRLGTGDDIGKAAVFLASSDSEFVTGTELFLDGGAGQI